jgi:hypothetical protein
VRVSPEPAEPDEVTATAVAIVLTVIDVVAVAPV